MSKLFESGALNVPTMLAFATPAGSLMLESVAANAAREAQEKTDRETQEAALLESAKVRAEEVALLESVQTENGTLKSQISNLQTQLAQRPAGVYKTTQELFDELLVEAAGAAARGDAASIVTEWVNLGDASAESFEELALTLAGIDDTDTDLTDDQINAFNDALNAMAEAAIALGANQDDVTTMVDDDDSDAAQAVMDSLGSLMTESVDELALIANHAFADVLEDGAMMESTVKVVRNGAIILKHKRPRKFRMSGLQKAALKKAQLKSHSATAKLARAKSMKIRRKRGL